MSEPNYFDITALSSEKISGSNLIEASAGTGKTYSIALLVLRLVIEKNIPVNQILMVTFTNAAVEELQDRVRQFLVKANEYANGENIDNEQIKIILDGAKSLGVADIAARLRTSLLLLDEATIVTIHSFCQQVLNRYAFETQQIFGAKLQTDISDIREGEINKFWRKNITSLPVEILNIINVEGLKSSLSTLIKKFLSGRHYKGFKHDDDYSLDVEFLMSQIRLLEQNILTNNRNIQIAFKKYFNDIEGILKKFPRSAEAIENNDLEELVDIVKEAIEKGMPKYIFKLPPPFLDAIDNLMKAENALSSFASSVTQQIKCFALQCVVSVIKERLLRSNILTYDDLIHNLHRAVMQGSSNESLLHNVRNDYKAVFIDEFQDTDQEQFDIFKKFFLESEDNISFLIGDPKQSIYSFRGADVDAYLLSKRLVGAEYTMNTNYRSTQKMVDAANAFFLPYENFDTFFYGENFQDGIRYHSVNVEENDGALLQYDEPTASLEIWDYKNKPAAALNIAHQISQLLNPQNQYQIKDKKGILRGVKPADIGILVRSGRDGREIKNLLEQLGIPAVQVLDEKVLNDDTAKEISQLLEAVIDPSIDNIRQALFTNLIGKSVEELKQLNSETVAEIFHSYHQLWMEENVFEVLSKIKAAFGLEERLLSNAGGQRVLANYVQIMQLLQKQQHKKGFSPEELLAWLNKSRQGLYNEGDEFETQIESDEDAVKIVTIHKSKGLEYNIVFCAHLSFSRALNYKWDYTEYEHPDSGFVFADTTQLDDDEIFLHEAQNEQENRRLMYVAITRAVYKCYIIFSIGRNFNQQTSSLAPFLDAMDKNSSNFLRIEGPEIVAAPHSKEDAKPITFLNLHNDDIVLSDRYWRRMSYSALSLKGEPFAPLEAVQDQHEYDNFIFTTLAFGAHTGTMLHYLFEHISFQSSSLWNKTMVRKMSQFSRMSHQVYQEMLPKMLNHVLHADIVFSQETFSLSRVEDAKTLKELEFNFLLSPVNVAALQDVLNRYAPVRLTLPDTATIEGLMNGFIDLFFEYDGKYYILDWKSNYLGNTLHAYNTENISVAMEANNYHLQYLIYTVAVYKFLKSRLPDFDYDLHVGGVVYVFLRGAREHNTSGIFTARPDKKLIEDLVALLS